MTGLINFIISSLVYFLAMRNGHIVSVPFMFFYEKSRNHTFIIYVVPAFLLIDAIAAAILIALWAKEQRK